MKIYFRLMVSTEVADTEAPYDTLEVIRQIERTGWHVEEITRLVGEPTVPGKLYESIRARYPEARGKLAYLGSCNLSGHAERGCDGDLTPSTHRSLIREGVGFSVVPGPDDAEIAAESADLSKSRMERIVDDPMSDV